MGNRRTKLRALVKDLHPEIVAEAKAEAQIEIDGIKKQLDLMDLANEEFLQKRKESDLKLAAEKMAEIDDLKERLAKSIAYENIASYELKEKEKAFRELESEVLSLKEEISQLQLKLIETGVSVAEKEVVTKTPDKKKKKG